MATRYKKTTSDYIKEAKAIHGDKYDYSKSEYTRADNKITITCKEHGDFQIRAVAHILKSAKPQGCRKCGNIERGLQERANRAKTLIADFKKVHGDRYDYSESIYHGFNKKIKIRCKVHGVFEMTPATHIHQKSNCKKCIDDDLKKNGAHNRIDTNIFIKRAIEKHGDAYNYSKTVFTGMHMPITVICNKHNEEFTQSKAQNHLENEFNCPTCLQNRYDEHRESIRLSIHEVKKRIKEIHGDFIEVIDFKNYSNVESKILFRCNRFDWHNDFYSTFHMATGRDSSGCPICKMSKGQREIILILNRKGISHETEKYFKELGKKRFDIFINDLNLIIEYNGRQHYIPVEPFGGEKGLKRTQNSDKLKKQYCIDNQINYEVIRYDEVIDKRMDEILSKYS